MYHRPPPFHNLPWPPYNCFRTFPNHISYPSNIQFRRPATSRVWSRSGIFASPRKEVRRNEEKEATQSESIGPPPGFEKKQNHRRCEKEKDDLTANKASNTIHISNVAVQMRSEEVKRCCEVFGKVERISFLKSYKFPESMVCFIRYKDEGQAEIAQRRLGGTRRYGKIWRVSWAKRDLQPVLNDGRGNEEPKCDDAGSDKKGTEGRIMGEGNEEILKILKNSWMMVNEKHKNIEEIRECIDRYGGQEVSLIQWGIYGNIAVCKNEELIGEWERRIDELRKHFVKIEKLDPKEKRLSRYCWIDVKGIPIQAWSIGTMVSIANHWGKLLALDIETDMAYRIDIARLFIETKEVEKVEGKKDFWFQDEGFQIIVEEVERDEEVIVSLSQNSVLGKHPILATEDGLEGIVQEKGGDKQRDNYEKNINCKSAEILQSNNLELFLSNGDDSGKEKHWDSSFMVNEGFGDTQVAETPSLREACVNRTLIFVSKSTESKRRGETFGDKDIEGCTCCIKFHKGGIKRQEGVDTNEDQIGRKAKGRSITRASAIRKNGGNKIKTPKRRTHRIPRKGLFVKETKITKNKGRRGRKKRKEGKEGGYGLKDASSTSVDFVKEGLDLCEELGVKIKCNSAKRLQFEEFMREPNKQAEQKEEINRASR